MPTAITRIFRSGNSLAVRIPKAMTPADVPAEAQIEWNGVVWTVRPLHRRSLAGLMDAFRAFPADFMAQGREFHEQEERDWSGFEAEAEAEADASAVERDDAARSPKG